MADGCLACDLAAGRRPLPGGRIFRTEFWLVEHCVGPLGLGTLIVKPERHVTTVTGLSAAEAAELGPLLRQSSWVAGQLTGADQVYNCLWSHLGGKPGHIHYVVQPVTRVQTDAYEAFGIGLQVAMSLVGDFPDGAEVARLAERARELFALGLPPDRNKPPDERNVDPHRVRRPRFRSQ
jgi:diadenosine tetraphosphate (Ap4A) HIT family hydrolase